MAEPAIRTTHGRGRRPARRSYWTTPVNPRVFDGWKFRSIPLKIMRKPGCVPIVRSSCSSLRPWTYRANAASPRSCIFEATFDRKPSKAMAAQRDGDPQVVASGRAVGPSDEGPGAGFGSAVGVTT